MTTAFPPEASPGLLLWRVTLQWQRRIAAVLRPLGLTHVQFVLLTSVWWLTDHAAEHPSQRRVADFAATDVMMTSQVLRTLVTKGLVERRADPDDARSKLVSVTPAGRELARRAVREVEAVDRAWFAPVGGDELVDVLRRLDRS